MRGYADDLDGAIASGTPGRDTSRFDAIDAAAEPDLQVQHRLAGPREAALAEAGSVEEVAEATVAEATRSLETG